MHSFWASVIHPLLVRVDAKVIVEIGSENGELSRDLASYCKEVQGTLHTIDTKTPNTAAQYQQEFGVAYCFHKGKSLNILPILQGYDAVIVDGDHNWFTVLNELRQIAKGSEKTGVMPLVILHDVGWPYGRRDVYYNPSAIPTAFLLPQEQKGMLPGRPELQEGAGLSRDMMHAIYENTMRNGVRTAVEDFLKDYEKPMHFLVVPGMFGIGILASEKLLQQHPELEKFIKALTPTKELEQLMQAIEDERLAEVIDNEDKQIAMEVWHNDLANCMSQKKLLEGSLEMQKNQLRKIQKDNTVLRTQLETAKHSLSQLHAKQHHLISTKSWKLTAPLRFAGGVVRTVLHRKQTSIEPKHIASVEPIGKPVVESKQRVPHPIKENILQRASEKKLVFAPSDHPQVSIIIPVFNKIEYTYKCLESIVQHTTNIPYEVLVVDDSSTDETQEILTDIAGITVLRNEQNSGFTVSCNRGAQAARGAFLLFLNNDTLVRQNWLKPLLHTFEIFPNSGIVGPKIIAEDGLLLDAGGTVWNDGSAWNIGRGENPDKPEYNFTREVDYCSGSCLMIPKKLFTELHGFDDLFSPAYYEDTDLAFRVRQAGYDVRYQPRSEIMHYEGVTAGTDTSHGIKQYQVIHQMKFLQRWKDALAHHLPPSTKDHWLAQSRKHPSILVIDIIVPRPDSDSGSLRMSMILKLLGHLSPSITFISQKMELENRYVHALQSRGIEVFYAPHIHSITEYIAKHAKEFDIIILSRCPVAYEYIEDVRYYAPNAQIIFDTVDLHHIRHEREVQLKGGKRERRHAKDIQRQEIYAAKTADTVLVVSEEEKEILHAILPKKTIVQVPNIHEIPKQIAPLNNREGLLFVGGFYHKPNVDAILWFTKEIFPGILRIHPDMHLWIVGSNPPENMRSMANDSITVTGYIPDISSYLQHCRVSIAPLRFGAGMKGKVTQSLIHGLPVVSTRIGAEGLGLQHERDILIAQSPDEFIKEVVRLYNDETLWNTLSVNGAQKISELCSPERALQQLKNVLNI